MKILYSVAVLFSLFTLSQCKSTGDQAGELKGHKKVDPKTSTQFARFDIPLTNLERSISDATDIKDAAKKFVNGPARIAAYQLQALGRIYQNQDKWFKKFRGEFQEIEDTIGEYDKWKSILKNAPESLSESEKSSLETKKAKALDKVENLLASNSWFGAVTGRGETLRQELALISWEKPSKDREYVLGFLAGELKEMRDTTYQFTSLENDKGLHELRRDMKWILIEMRVLNGLVLKDTAACTVKKYAALPTMPIAKSKYSELPSSDLEKNACLIPECLFLGLVQAVEDIGKLKDEAEIRLNTSNVDKDAVPVDLQKSAEAFYAELVDGKLFGRTHDAVKSCLK